MSTAVRTPAAAPTLGTAEGLSEVERLLMLAEVAEHVDGFTALDRTIDRLCGIVLDVMECDYACVRLPEENAQVLRIRGASESSAFSHDEFLDLTTTEVSGPLPGHRPPSVEAYLTGQLQLVPHLDNAAGELPWQRHTRSLGIRSMVSLPLVRHAAVTGVLNCYWKRGFNPTDAQLLTLQVVGRLIALAIETARREERRERQSEQLAEETPGGRPDVAGALLTAQAELLSLCARPSSTAITGMLQSLTDRLRRPVVLEDDQRRVVASEGAPDQVKALLSREAEAPDDVVLAGPHGTVGHLVLGAAPADADEEFASRLLAAVKPLLTLLLDQRAGALSSSRLARPYALLALCGGSLGGSQTTVALDVLGVGAHSAVEIAVTRFETADAALAFSTQTISQAPGWGGAVACVASGREAITLLSAGPASGAAPVRPLNAKRHLGMVSTGLSRRFSRLQEAPAHLEQARYAAVAAPAGGLVRFSDLGATADMCMHLPRPELEAVVERQLGPLKRHDAEHGGDLLATLETYVAAHGSADAAAELLTVHRNTVKQRIRKITELCEMDLKSYETLANVVMVLRWNRYLEGDAR